MGSIGKILAGTYFAFLGIILTVGIVVVVVYAFVPFSPENPTNYEIRQEQVCPGAPVDAIVTRERDDPIGNMHKLELSENWRTVDVKGYARGKDVFINEAMVPNPQPQPEEKVLSPALKRAPVIPGEWTVSVNGEMSGSQVYGILDREQDFSLRVNDSLTVLPSDHPQCQEEDR